MAESQGGGPEDPPRDELGRVVGREGAAALARLSWANRTPRETPHQAYTRAFQEGAPPSAVKALIERACKMGLSDDPDAKGWAKLVLDRAVPLQMLISVLGSVPSGGAPGVDLSRLSRAELEQLQRLYAKARAPEVVKDVTPEKPGG